MEVRVPYLEFKEVLIYLSLSFTLIMFISYVFEVKLLELNLRNEFGKLEFDGYSDCTNRAQNRMCGAHSRTCRKHGKQVEHSEIKACAGRTCDTLSARAVGVFRTCGKHRGKLLHFVHRFDRLNLLMCILIPSEMLKEE